MPDEKYRDKRIAVIGAAVAAGKTLAADCAVAQILHFG